MRSVDYQPCIAQSRMNPRSLRGRQFLERDGAGLLERSSR